MTPLVPAMLWALAAARVAADSAAPGLVWPSPPDRARIQHVRTIASGADFESDRGMFGRLLGVLFGEADAHPWLVQPVGIAVSPSGLLAVADPGAHGVHIIDLEERRYRLITETASGPFRAPVGVAFAADGSLYVTDSEASCIAVFDDDFAPDRVIDDSLGRPTGIVVAGDTVHVIDTERHRLVHFSRDGRVLGTSGGRGTGGGLFNFPVQLAGRDTLYVVDALNYRVQTLLPSGTFIASFGSMGNVPGTFAGPKAVARDSEGHLYVTDALFDDFQIFDGNGRLLLVVGRQGTQDGEFMSPGGIAIDSRDRVYVVDTLNRRIQIFRYLP